MNIERGLALYVGIPCAVIGAGMFVRLIFEVMADTARWSMLELSGMFIVDALLLLTGIVLIRSASRK
jgi:hypothetical protein